MKSIRGYTQIAKLEHDKVVINIIGNEMVLVRLVNKTFNMIV